MADKKHTINCSTKIKYWFIYTTNCAKEIKKTLEEYLKTKLVKFGNQILASVIVCKLFWKYQ